METTLAHPSMVRLSGGSRFFDYTTNIYDPVAASATARVRREALTTRAAWVVDWIGRRGPWYWNGGRQDALELAKSLALNGQVVELTSPTGQLFDSAAILAMRY